MNFPRRNLTPVRLSKGRCNAIQPLHVPVNCRSDTTIECWFLCNAPLEHRCWITEGCCDQLLALLERKRRKDLEDPADQNGRHIHVGVAVPHNDAPGTTLPVCTSPQKSIRQRDARGHTYCITPVACNLKPALARPSNVQAPWKRAGIRGLEKRQEL